MGTTLPGKGHPGVKDNRREDVTFRDGVSVAGWLVAGGQLAATCAGGWQEQVLGGQAGLAGLRGVFIFAPCLFSLSEVMKCRSQH